MSTPDTTVSPVTTATIETNKQEVVTPSPVSVESTTSLQILDGITSLCNTTLYVLTKGFYPGADAHLVNQAKEFIKEIKKDVESKRKAVSNGKDVDLGQGV